MQRVVFCLGACALLSFGQTIRPDQPVARVDGEVITAAKLEAALTGAPTLALSSADKDPAEFLTWNALMNKMSKEAEKLGLDKKAPYIDRIEWNRNQVLMMARLEEKNREATPADQELEALYRDQPQRFGVAKTKLIFIPARPGQETAAKALMDAIAHNARNGADFVQLVKQYSQDEDSASRDGDFPDIDANSKIAEPIRRTIFTTKPGEVTPVISQPAGFYLFKVISVAMRPLAEVAQESRGKAAEERSNEWMAAEKAKASVKILHEAFFKSLNVTGAKVVMNGADALNLQASPQTAEIKPTTLLAEINGTAMTAADYTGMIKALPPHIRSKAIMAPTDFLQDYAFMRRLVNEAQTMGLDQKQPYRNRIVYDRNMNLMQAAVDDHLNNIVITVDEQKAGYAADANRFRVADARVLYIAYSLTPPPTTDPNAPKVLNEDEARQKIESILAEYRSKKDDFVAYVMKFSEDQASRDDGGKMRPIHYTDPQVPDPIRQVLFNAKPGDVVGPVKLANGWYLFKVDALTTRSYEEVKDQIYEELRQQRFQNWFNAQRDGFKITVDDPATFKLLVAKAQGKPVGAPKQ